MNYGSFLPDMPVTPTGATLHKPSCPSEAQMQRDDHATHVKAHHGGLDEAPRLTSQAERTLHEVTEAGWHAKQELERLNCHLGNMEEALKDHLKPAFSTPEPVREEVKEDHPESSHVTGLRKLRDLHRDNLHRIMDITQTVIGFTDRLVIP